MAFDKLSDSLKNTLSKIKNSITVDRNLVEEVVKEIQKSLLSSDVNVRLVLELTKQIRQRAISENNPELTKKEHLITIIYEELSKFLGEDKEFELKSGQNRILLIGLYGQGKTTTTGKLANYFKNRSKKVALISTDTYRPAAYEQLKQYTKKLEIDVFGNPNKKNAIEIYSEFESELSKYDVVIIDSAGRDSLNEELVKEISNLNDYIKPTDTFLVLGADVGQTAQKQAEMFKEQLSITGVIITKLDGTGKGGGAISACAATDSNVKFIGVGEKIEELERFNPRRFVSELLGMGDLENLLEKASLAMNQDDAKKLEEKLISGDLSLDDVYKQMQSMGKIGSFSKILNMIPGFGSLNLDKNMINQQEDKVKRWKFMIDSMTKEEKKNPKIIQNSRLERISKGSGTKIEEIRELIKMHKQLTKMSSLFKNGGNLNPEDIDENQMSDLMKQFGGQNLFKKKGFR